METLFHFVFELIKVSILGGFYSALVLGVFKLIAHYYPNSHFGKFVRNETKLWFRTSLLISLGLCIFMFTYWGDHGLGDSARIPIGFGREVNQIDASSTFIQPRGYEFETLSINEFAVTKHYLITYVESEPVSNLQHQIAVWDLKTNQVHFFKNSETLESFSKANILNGQHESKDFRKHYNEFWDGWRFWLLP